MLPNIPVLLSIVETAVGCAWAWTVTKGSLAMAVAVVAPSLPWPLLGCLGALSIAPAPSFCFSYTSDKERILASSLVASSETNFLSCTDTHVTHLFDLVHHKPLESRWQVQFFQEFFIIWKLQKQLSINFSTCRVFKFDQELIGGERERAPHLIVRRKFVWPCVRLFVSCVRLSGWNIMGMRGERTRGWLVAHAHCAWSTLER